MVSSCQVQLDQLQGGDLLPQIGRSLALERSGAQGVCFTSCHDRLVEWIGPVSCYILVFFCALHSLSDA